MKQYFAKAGGSIALLSMLCLGAVAQEPPRAKERRQNDDVIIIRPKVNVESKITIEIKGNEVKVNGKPLAEFKDKNLSVIRRKEMMDEDLAGRPKIMMDMLQDENGARSEDLMAPRSRFRGGTLYKRPGNSLFITGIPGNKALLGVGSEKIDDTEGASITNVTEESAADKAGLKEGDLIIRINDTKIESPEALTKAIGKFNPGDKIMVVYIRDKKEQKTEATLTKRNDAQAFSFEGADGNSNFKNFNFDYAPFNHNNAFGWDSKPRLGIKAQEMEDGKGIKVLGVDEESPADKAGLKEGDIITSFNGVEVNNVDNLRELAKPALEKTSFSIKITRDGKAQDLEVKIPKNLKSTDL